MEATSNFTTLYTEKCEQKGLDCPICFEPYTNPHIITTCLHVFCKTCLEKSMDRRAQCPSCNTAFKAEDLKYSFNDNNRLEAIKNKIEEKLGIKPEPKPAPVSPKKRKTPSEGPSSSPIKKTIKNIIQEDDIVLKDKNEYFDAISIAGGIKATNCYQLRHLIAIKDINLRNVNADEVTSHEGKIIAMGSPKMTSEFNLIHASEKVCLVYASANSVKSTRDSVAIRASRIKEIEAVKVVIMSGCTVSDITLEARFEKDNPIPRACLHLNPHSEGLKNRVDGVIRVLPPQDKSPESIENVKLSIEGEGVLCGFIDFVDCEGNYTLSGGIKLGCQDYINEI